MIGTMYYDVFYCTVELILSKYQSVDGTVNIIAICMHNYTKHFSIINCDIEKYQYLIKYKI